ncbi:MAG: hypothetical protein ABIK19_00415 [candidate division WOR-3 bacterium]
MNREKKSVGQPLLARLATNYFFWAISKRKISSLLLPFLESPIND